MVCLQENEGVNATESVLRQALIDSGLTIVADRLVSRQESTWCRLDDDDDGNNLYICLVSTCWRVRMIAVHRLITADLSVQLRVILEEKVRHWITSDSSELLSCMIQHEMSVISELSVLVHPVINIHERSADDDGDDDDSHRGRIFDGLLFLWSAYGKFSVKTKCLWLVYPSFWRMEKSCDILHRVNLSSWFGSSLVFVCVCLLQCLWCNVKYETITAITSTLRNSGQQSHGGLNAVVKVEHNSVLNDIRSDSCNLW